MVSASLLPLRPLRHLGLFDVCEFCLQPTSFLQGTLAAQRYLRYGLARGLGELGHDVRVICAESWNTGRDAAIRYTDDEYLGIKVRRLHFNWKKSETVFQSLYNNQGTTRLVGKYMAEMDADLLHVDLMLHALSQHIRGGKEPWQAIAAHCNRLLVRLCPQHFVKE